MKKGLIYSLILLICGFVVSGCDIKKTKEYTVEANVNDTIITRSEVDQATDNLLMQYQGKVPPEQMNRIRPMLRKQALENLINQQLLSQEVDRKGIQPDKQAVDKQLAEIAGRFPTPEKFKEYLANLGISEQELLQNIGRNLKIKILIDRQIGAVKEVSEEELEAFYRDNPDRFRMPERVQASHILIASLPDESPEDRAKKRLKLSGLRGEIEKGADFAQLAREHSSCPSKSQGGDLGYFERDKMVKPFADAAFKMRVGEISDIVETKFGYHLIKLTDRQDARIIPLEETRDDITSSLNIQKRGQLVSDYLNKLRSTAKIEYPEGSQP